MSDDERPTVLAVDDEPNVAAAYAIYLGDDYAVETATDGESALAAIDDSVDVVLLDRRMPDLTGDEVLAEIRARGHDCQVAMVTAVDPTVDVLEMAFDAYLTKPVDKAALVEAVDRLVAVSRHDDVVRERFRLAQKRAAVESGADGSRLDGNEAYQALLDRLAELEAQMRERAETMDSETSEAIFRDLPDVSEP